MPAAPLTFFALGVGDLQVAVGCLQLLAAHDLALEVMQGDVEAVEADGIKVQFGRELVVHARHGWGQAVPAPRRRLLVGGRTMGRGLRGPGSALAPSRAPSAARHDRWRRHQQNPCLRVPVRGFPADSRKHVTVHTMAHGNHPPRLM